MSNATRVSITKTAITLDSLGAGEYQKEGTITAQLRQTITKISYYPSKKVDNELSGGLFAASDFGFHEQEFVSTENRVAWILVPVSFDEARVLAELEKANKAGACIYRVLSNQPILSDDQRHAIKENWKTLDAFANSQVMRYPEGHKTEGEIILVDGSPVYRKTFFWNTERADEDLRKGSVYYTPEMKEELGMNDEPAFKGQSVDDVPF